LAFIRFEDPGLCIISCLKPSFPLGAMALCLTLHECRTKFCPIIESFVQEFSEKTINSTSERRE